MSLYNLIQKKIFNTYEEWHLKSSLFNCTGFHIVGIDNNLKAMQDGYSMYVEICPPHEIKGCTSMKAIGGKEKKSANLYLTIQEKKYCIPDLSYNEIIKIMRAFVKKSVLPDEKTYVEIFEDDNEKIKNSFYELAQMLIGDSEYTGQFIKKIKAETLEDMEDAWGKLYEELLLRERVLELDWKSRKDVFITAVKKLIEGTELQINENILDEKENIPKWSGELNSLWTDYILAAMDVGSDSYVLLVLRKEEFNRAKELARIILHRIDPAEKM